MSPENPTDDQMFPAGSLDDIDWSSFHFPTRPGTRSTKDLLTGMVDPEGYDYEAGSIQEAYEDTQGKGGMAGRKPAAGPARSLPGTKPGRGLAHEPHYDPNHGNATMGRAPDWALQPTRIESWHLDAEKWLLSHPGLRKKVELLRVSNRRKLAMLVDLVAFQPTDMDQAALLRGIHNALYMAFGVGLGEMLAMGPDSWEWPLSVQMGGARGNGSGNGTTGGRSGWDGMDDQPKESEESLERRRMGLNGF